MDLSIVTSCAACPPGDPVGLFADTQLIGCYPSLADAIKHRTLLESDDVPSIAGIVRSDDEPDDIDIDDDDDELPDELDEDEYRAIRREMDAFDLGAG